MSLGLLLAAVVAAGLFYGVNTVVLGRPSGPAVTPSPPATPYPQSQDPNQAAPGESIDLDQPLPHPLKINIGGRDVILPTGSVSEDRVGRAGR